MRNGSLTGRWIGPGARRRPRFSMLWEVSTESGTLLEKTSALNGLIAALSFNGGLTPPVVGEETGAVRRAREYLQTYYAEDICLADLAEVAGLSPFRLCRAFAKSVGVPPHAYQVQLRVRQARRLLFEGASVVEAAGRAGFADQSHLGRHFKKLVAMSPGEYRRAARTSPAPPTTRGFPR